MTTEAAVATSDIAPTNPAVFEPVASEVKTDAERDYFKSRGEKAEGLFKAPAQTDNKPAATEAKPAATQAPAEGAEDGEIEVEDSGNVRDQKTGRFVPKSAFLRVKGELQTKSTEAQSLRENLIQARERLSILTEVLPKAEAKAEAKKETVAEPDPQADVFGWITWAKAQLAELKGQVTQTAEQTQADRDRAGLQQFFTSDVGQFSGKNPDFADALQHGITVRHKMLEAVGVKDEGQRQKMVLQEINDLVRESKANGTSVAAKLYEAAKALGYAKKAVEQPVDKTPEALAEIARINGAQAASKTLGSGGGTGVGEALTRDKLANMGDADFSNARTAYIAKHGRGAWNDFLSGSR